MTIDDIAAKDYDLSVNKYVKYHEEEVRSYAEVKADFDAALVNVKLATSRFREMLEKFGIRNSEFGMQDAKFRIPNS